MNKRLTIVELPSFLTNVDKVITSLERDALIDYLSRHPREGDIIPKTGGVRKLRWAKQGKGKRGGYRVIYYLYNEISPLFLLTVYDKSMRANLTPKQEHDLSQLVRCLKQTCKVKKEGG